MKSNKNSKAENYNSELLDEMLQQITPEEQFQIDQKMLRAATIYDEMKANGWDEITLAQKMGVHPSEIAKLLSGT
jgi:hypothetical protein